MTNLARRMFLRRYPAPPPTPEGMVWCCRPGMAMAELVSAEEYKESARNYMEFFDKLPREMRDKINYWRG